MRASRSKGSARGNKAGAEKVLEEGGHSKEGDKEAHLESEDSDILRSLERSSHGLKGGRVKGLERGGGA